jgi:predicted Rossmann-fold nucleotide-binding protein
LFEILTLIQTKKIEKIPIVLYGKDYWTPLVSWFEQTLRDEFETISPEDLKLFTVVDSVDEAFKYIQKNVKTKNVRQV